MNLIRDSEKTIDKIFLKPAVVISAILIYATLPFILSAQDTRNCSYKATQSQISQRAGSIEDKGQLISIPIVVHVIYANSQQNISDEQIGSQLKVLIEDFTRINSDTVNTLIVFKKVAGNAKINFYLAAQDQFGNPTNGITRTHSSHGPFANDDIHYKDKGGENPWPTNRFLNVWVCDLADGIFGFASPIGSASSIEGIVIDFKFFGTIGLVSAPFDKGRTATHEVGHWMGLKHIWGDSGGCTDDDGITDTPPQVGPSSGCNLTRASCGNLNMVQNFMDTSNDACVNLFTKEQVSVMRKNLFTYGQKLIRDEVVTGVTEQKASAIEIIQIGTNQYKIKSEHSIDLLCICDLVGHELYWEQEAFSRNEVNVTLSCIDKILIVIIFSGKEKIVKKFIAF
ncbi:MAG: zinc metalloprotease [Pseudomonadota bacterium]